MRSLKGAFMTQLLIRLFIRRPNSPQDPRVRAAYGNLASVVGMVCNILLCLGKFVVGTLFGTAVGLFLQKLLISAFSIGIAAEMVDPLFYILASFLGAVLIGLLGGVGPIRRLIREPIVEEIRAQD